MAATQQAPAWEVTGQMETVGQIEGGAYGEGVKITFRTATGVVGSVFVPHTAYNAVTVAALIGAKAAALAEVSALKG